MKTFLKQHYFATVAVVATLLAAALMLVGIFFINQYEKGVLEVCADQQDAYVQLVLEQIYINESRSDAAIIEEILGTLDASTNKYWTFSKGEAMLFVKDVTETNKYKGFTTATYYISESAHAFLGELALNHVTHSTIQIEDRDYIASGVIFSYAGASYRLCLLTNEDVFLDNNAFLGAKINLAISFGIAVLLMAVGSMVFARKIGVLEKESLSKDQIIVELNGSIAKLNDRLLVRATYDIKRTLFQESMLEEFLGRIQAKGITPVTFALFNCASEGEFLKRTQVVLDRSVLRFRLSGEQEYVSDKVAGQILLVFLHHGKQETYDALRPLLTISVTLRDIQEWTPASGDIAGFVQRIREENA